MSEEDAPPLSETGTEPAPLRIATNGPPHAGDAACIIIPCRSLTTSLRTPVIERSRTNSVDHHITESLTTSLPTDLISF
jgi:hypothetical protein